MEALGEGERLQCWKTARWNLQWRWQETARLNPKHYELGQAVTDAEQLDLSAKFEGTERVWEAGTDVHGWRLAQFSPFDHQLSNEEAASLFSRENDSENAKIYDHLDRFINDIAARYKTIGKEWDAPTDKFLYRYVKEIKYDRMGTPDGFFIVIDRLKIAIFDAGDMLTHVLYKAEENLSEIRQLASLYGLHEVGETGAF